MAALGPVIYDIYVQGVRYNQQPLVLDAQLVQEFSRHDMMYIRIEYPHGYPNLTNLSIWPDDTPLQIFWGRAPDVNVWYGYVNHHEIKSAADSGTNNIQLSYVCIGSSGILNADVNRKWEQVSPTYIARKIAFENSFRAVVTPISDYMKYPIDYEVQANESDFSFLKRIAQRTGLRFWCSGGSLYMISPIVALTGGGQSAPPQYTMNRIMQSLDTCRNFHYLKGKNLPGAVQTNRVIYGVDSATNQIFTASHQPKKTTSRVAAKTTTAVQDYRDAKQRIDGWAALAQFWISAQAQLYGNTELYPGKLVDIEGAALPDNAAGYWLISKVTHSMVQSGSANTALDKYLSNVVLLRNTEESNTVVLANQDPVVPEFTAMKLNSNHLWTSTTLAAVLL